MRYFVGFVLALASVAAPLGASAQAGEHDAGDEPGQHQTRTLYTEGLLVASPTLGEVAAPSPHPELALLLIPRHLQQRIPQASPETSFGLDYKEKAPEKTQEELEREKRRRRLGLGLGLGLGFPLVVGAVAGAAAMTTSLSF